jgi:hypothetical protein
MMEMFTNFETRVRQMEKSIMRLESSNRTSITKKPNNTQNFNNPPTCGRCKRPGHGIQNCYATKDIQGNFLN